MSIRDRIRALEAVGALERYVPNIRQPARRRLFLSNRVAESLTNSQSSLSFFGQVGYVRAALTRWTTGGWVRVNEDGDPIFLKPLQPPPLEVWEIKVTEPDPQVRLFGRFAEPDTLVITHTRGRNELGNLGSGAWSGAMLTCEKLWNELFPDHPPFVGVRSGDYVTENCDDFKTR